MKTNTLLNCNLRIPSKLSLEELAETISRHVFGGVKFIGKEEFIRDEFPAVYTESTVLGARFILTEDPEQSSFYLDADNRKLTAVMTLEEVISADVDVSILIGSLIESQTGLKVEVLKPERPVF